jgi:integrase
MPRPRPRYLQRRRSRHGKPYWCVQKFHGGPKLRIPDDLVYGTDPFWAAFDALVGSAPVKPVTPPTLTTGKGTLAWAWELYKRSGAWKSGIGDATRGQRENIMLHVLETAGTSPLADIDTAAIKDGVDRRAHTPSQAKNFKQMMSQFFVWLVDAKIVETNPCLGVKLPKRPDTGGFKEWSLNEIEKYEAFWPIGTRERVMLDVYMYTGLRRGDAARVGKQHVRDGVISIATEKSKGRTVVHLPMLAVLKATLDAGPIGDLAWNVGVGKRPYTKESLGNVFKEACVSAGILDKAAHGLRKAAATRAADCGATAHELMAIFGWIDIKEAEIYTRNADRKRLAARAMGMLGPVLQIDRISVAEKSGT